MFVGRAQDVLSLMFLKRDPGRAFALAWDSAVGRCPRPSKPGARLAGWLLPKPAIAGDPGCDPVSVERGWCVPGSIRPTPALLGVHLLRNVSPKPPEPAVVIPLGVLGMVSSRTPPTPKGRLLPSPPLTTAHPLDVQRCATTALWWSALNSTAESIASTTCDELPII